MTTTRQIEDHEFLAKVAFGDDCRYCDKPRKQHAIRPDVFSEAEYLDRLAKESEDTQQ